MAPPDNSTTSQVTALSSQVAALMRERRYEEAVGLLDDALATRPEEPVLWSALGRCLNNLGQYDAAANAFRELIRQRPRCADAHDHLGHVLRANGDLTGARSAFLRAIELDPGLARPRRNLGTVLAAQGKLAEAAEELRNALRIEPDDVDTQLNLARVLQRLERHREAIDVYEAVLRGDPGSVDVRVGLGELLHALGEVETAKVHYLHALEADPGSQRALAGAALAYEVLGELERGWELVRAPLESGRAEPELAHAAARLLRRQGRHAEALALLEPLRTAPESSWSSRPQLYFTLGEIHDELGNADEAFACFERANSLKPKGRFDGERHRAYVDELIDFFGTARPGHLPRAAARDPCPIFVVGMPRSGTSLVEQILASHPEVHAGGERLDIPRLVRELSAKLGGRYPRCLSRLTPASIGWAARRYREHYGPSEPGAACITDKLPLNFLNLALIGLVLPNARIVHCRRHPLATVVSIFFQNFSHYSQPFASRLEDIAAYYEQYVRLMEHWRGNLDVPLLELDYEALVADQEAVSRELIAFAGLPWDARCLAFFETERTVKTASYAQVRQPIYTSSLVRHERYLPHLQVVIDRLGGTRAVEKRSDA